MALEQLISTKKLKNNKLYAFFIGFFCAIIGMLLSLRIFQEYASIVMITFTILPLVGVIYKLVSEEEQEYEKHKHILWHNPVLSVFAFLFLGMVVAYTVGYITTPQTVAQNLFANQLDTMRNMDGPVAYSVVGLCQDSILQTKDYTFCQTADVDNDGNLEAIYYKDQNPSEIRTHTGNTYSYKKFVFGTIFLNNFKLYLLVFLLSLLFGAGALFVLAWNASILGVFFGSALGNLMDRAIGIDVYSSLPITVWTIWLHGIPEFTAFFMSAISGGTLGIVLIKRKYEDKLFKNVINQCSTILVMSLIILAIAAAIEVMVLGI